MSRFSTRMNRRVEVVSDSTMEALTRYDWPGNIRELQNFIERSVILSPGVALQAPLESLSESVETPLASAGPLTLKEAEATHIISVLNQANWVVGGPKGAAEKLGVKRTTLIATMRRLGITRPEVPAAA